MGGDQDAIRGTQTHSEAIRVIEVVPPDAGGNQTPSEALRRNQRRLERDMGGMEHLDQEIVETQQAAKQAHSRAAAGADGVWDLPIRT